MQWIFFETVVGYSCLFNSEHKSKLSTDYSVSDDTKLLFTFAEMTGDQINKGQLHKFRLITE